MVSYLLPSAFCLLMTEIEHVNPSFKKTFSDRAVAELLHSNEKKTLEYHLSRFLQAMSLTTRFEMVKEGTDGCYVDWIAHKLAFSVFEASTVQIIVLVGRINYVKDCGSAYMDIAKLPFPIFKVNTQGHILSSNAAGIGLCSNPLDSLADIADAGQKPLIQKMLQTDQVSRFQFQSAEAEPKHYSAWIIPEQATTLTVILQDETPLKKSLQSTEEKLTQRTDWLCQMSHEIRTTLNGIVGFMEMLLETNLNEDQRNCARIIMSSGQSLQTMLSEVLDFSKLESGKRALLIQETNLQQLIQQLTLLFSGIAKSKGINLQVEYETDLDKLAIMTDELCIRQILTNLLSNCIKFTTHGYVKVRAKHSMVCTDRADISICIEDTGVGIPSESYQKLFHKFAQGTNVMNHEGGSGLGLEICKQLVDLLGGTISFKSQVNCGTTFWFNFQCTVKSGGMEPVPQRDLTKSEEAVNAKGERSVLIVEDNIVNQKVLLNVLKKYPNLHLLVANNGKEAIDIVQKTDVDIILMDCIMPLCNGYEATLQIRKFNTKIPIVAMTANTDDTTKQLCKDVGMNDFLTKPIVRSELGQVVSKWL